MKHTTELPTDTLVTEYRSPLGGIILAASGDALRGAWFKDQKYACAGLVSREYVPASQGLFPEVTRWLDAYFAGYAPLPSFPIEPSGTDFQKRVWAELLTVPYGKTATYKAIADSIECKSARAVGSAIGRNPISIIIPCHRVIGSGGELIGYAGGLDRKRKLLDLERSAISK